MTDQQEKNIRNWILYQLLNANEMRDIENKNILDLCVENFFFAEAWGTLKALERLGFGKCNVRDFEKNKVFDLTKWFLEIATEAINLGKIHEKKVAREMAVQNKIFEMK